MDQGSPQALEAPDLPAGSPHPRRLGLADLRDLWGRDLRDLPPDLSDLLHLEALALPVGQGLRPAHLAPAPPKGREGRARQGDSPPAVRDLQQAQALKDRPAHGDRAGHDA